MSSAIPHALVGWPSFASELQNAGVAADVVAGLSIGWYFGSAAMIAMGLAVVIAAPHVGASTPAFRVALAVGGVYSLFGVAASLARYPTLHFTPFIALGSLVVAGAIAARRADPLTSQPPA